MKNSRRAPDGRVRAACFRGARRLRRGAIIVFFLLVCPLGAGAEALTAAELLRKMTVALGPETDCFARLTVSIGGTAGKNGVRFYFFRSDARQSALLVQTAPEDARGFAFLRGPERLIGFNPACRCSSEVGPEAVAGRFGLSFAELIPGLLSAARPAGEPVAGTLDGAAVFTLVLEGEMPGERLVLSLATDTFLPVRLALRDASGEPLRTVDYLSYAEMGKRRFPRRFTVREDGGPAILVEADRISPRVLPDFIFTESYLEETAGQP
jgi:hypothetical protein